MIDTEKPIARRKKAGFSGCWKQTFGSIVRLHDVKDVEKGVPMSERGKETEKKGISRSSFVKLVGAGAAAVASTALVKPLVAQTGVPMKNAIPTKWDQVADVVVIGTGDAGGPAAIKAFDGGASVIMIDKLDYFGGCSALGGGNAQMVDTHIQKRDGVEDRPEWGFEDQMQLGLYRSNPDVLRTWTTRSKDVALWLEKTCECVFAKTEKQEGARVPRSHLPAAFGVHAAGRGIIWQMRFFAQLQKRKIPILLNHRMTRIIREPNGPVLGIEVQSPTGIINIKANKAVILASGGFKANKQMMRAWHPLMDEDFLWSGWPHVLSTGDGHLATMEIGGGMVDTSFITEFSHRIGTRLYVVWDKPFFDNKVKNAGLPANSLERTIIVENDGNRYINEAIWEAGHAVAWGPTVLAYLRLPKRPRAAWFVVDADGAAKMGWSPFLAAFSKPDPTTAPCLEPGWVATAATIEELAVKMGVPAANLQATISKFNEYAATGVDKDLERPAPMYPLGKPPFYAAQISLLCHDQSTGIRVNQRMQVVDQSDQWQPKSAPGKPIGEEKVIPHLYAAGECTGGTGGAIRGSGKRGWYMVHGFVAGEGAVKEKSI
ncbi:MAG: FAD-binding protein [Spirochaetota bacterium]